MCQDTCTCSEETNIGIEGGKCQQIFHMAWQSRVPGVPGDSSVAGIAGDVLAACALAHPWCRLRVHSSDAMCHTRETGDLSRLNPPGAGCQHGIPTACFPHLLRCFLQGVFSLKRCACC